MHIFFSVLMLVIWLILDGKMILMNGWRRDIFSYKKNFKKLLEGYKGPDSNSIILSFNKSLINLTKKEKIAMIKFINDGLGEIYSIPTLQYYWKNIHYILTDQTVCYFSFYICLSVIAFSRNVVILYSIHLLDIIVSFGMLENSFYLILLEFRKNLNSDFFHFLRFFKFFIFLATIRYPLECDQGHHP